SRHRRDAPRRCGLRRRDRLRRGARHRLADDHGRGFCARRGAQVVNVRVTSLYTDLAARMRALSSDHARVHSSRRVVEQALEDGKAYYGINTGFGALASKRIDPSALDRLQYNLLLSHAVGLGEWVPRVIAHLMLQLKLHSLSLGYS